MLRNMRDLGFGTRSKNFEKIIEEEIRDFIDNVQSEIEVSAWFQLKYSKRLLESIDIHF